MKLKLRASGDVQILTVSELMTGDVPVLRAGITKIFRTGKNHIILELKDAGQIPAEVLRELARLKLLANELSGDIVLAGLDEKARQAVENFSKPPFAACFATVEIAIQYFHPTEKPVDAAKAEADEATTHRERILQWERGDMGALRKENEKLRAENKSLMELLSTKMLERREPPDAKAYQDKIQILEHRLADMLNEAPSKKA